MGINYETSAVPIDFQTPLTTDLDHVTIALGAGVRPMPALRLDIMYAHLFGFSADVDPRTAGVSAVNPLKGNPVTRHIPVILVSAMDDRDAKARGLSSGADDLLTKPVNRAELCGRVRDWIRTS